jgi:hypothetical protein
LGKHFIKLSVDEIVSKYESAHSLMGRGDP